MASIGSFSTGSALGTTAATRGAEQDRINNALQSLNAPGETEQLTGGSPSGANPGLLEILAQNPAMAQRLLAAANANTSRGTTPLGRPIPGQGGTAAGLAKQLQLTGPSQAQSQIQQTLANQLQQAQVSQQQSAAKIAAQQAKQGQVASASLGGFGGQLGGALRGAQLPQGGGLQLGGAPQPSRQREREVAEMKEFEQRLRQIQLERERVQNSLLRQQQERSSFDNQQARQDAQLAETFATRQDRRQQAKLQQLIRTINSLVGTG